jgi:hypothetical protein
MFVYISATASWLAVNGITGATDSPLGPEHDEALTALLAARVARRFGVPVTADIMRDAASASRVLVRSKDRRQVWDDNAVLN